MKIIVETRQNPETEARGNDLANHLPKMEAHLGFNKVNLIKLKYQFGSAISTQRPDWPSTQPQQRPTGLFNFFPNLQSGIPRRVNKNARFEPRQFINPNLH